MFVNTHNKVRASFDCFSRHQCVGGWCVRHCQGPSMYEPIHFQAVAKAFRACPVGSLVEGVGYD